MFKTVTLEMSFKPFKKTDKKYVEGVVHRLFAQWDHLCCGAQDITVMLWIADGSEILEYDANPETKIEWARYMGSANPPPAKEGEERSLYYRSYLYTDNPPQFTYGLIAQITAIIKQVGREFYPDKSIRVGATFDPGPEFAKSDFKYNRHNEICVSGALGKKSFVCCYNTLHADSRPYAAFPAGIPEGTSIGKFFGAQTNAFLTDLGFDYIWLSNGFGFGSEPWSTLGAIFDGKRFDYEKIDEIDKKVLSFWHDFRSECKDFPVYTRGTNLTLGMDFASDGVSLKKIYEGGFNMVPPPNSPWAALDGDFGLETAGYLSRIGKLPDERYMFRYYLHDPWWVNSPWYDRYNSMPHDIYIPMSLCRIDESGSVQLPTDFSVLSVDNSFGDLPDSCIGEAMPHLLRAMHDMPDSPPPAVWVYPFDEYCTPQNAHDIENMYSQDWFIRGAINNGAPISAVVTTDIFTKQRDVHFLYSASILVTPVPKAHSAFEKAILDYACGGGKVIFYGDAANCSAEFAQFFGLEFIAAVHENVLPIEVSDAFGHTQSGIFNHKSPASCGEINTVSTKNVFAKSGSYALGVKAKNAVWLRASVSASFVQSSSLLIPDDAKKYYISEKLLRIAMGHLGCKIRLKKLSEDSLSPVMSIARSNNAFVFSVYSPSTSVDTVLEFPLGAPLLDSYEAIISGSTALYRFPACEHRECRVFVSQKDGLVSCREGAPVSAFFRRKLKISGLSDATVRVFPENYCKDSIHAILNPENNTFDNGTEKITPKYITDENGSYCEFEHVTGSLIIAMPSRKEYKNA